MKALPVTGADNPVPVRHTGTLSLSEVYPLRRSELCEEFAEGDQALVTGFEINKLLFGTMEELSDLGLLVELVAISE
jgi:hypothetical protein